MKHAIILCSGGIDSVTTAHLIKRKYSGKTILFFDYGQKSLRTEERCSRKCAENIDADFKKIKLPWIKEISDSLINKIGKVKKLKKEDLKNTKKESKKWYVPCRNLVFLSSAFSLAESFGGADIFVGFKFDAEGGYPDTTQKFVDEINKLAKISCSKKIKLFAPLIKKDKEDIIKLGGKLGVNFRQTHSCYIQNKKHCGYCLACQLRKQGFYWAGVEDTTEYGY